MLVKLKSRSLARKATRWRACRSRALGGEVGVRWALGAVGGHWAPRAGDGRWARVGVAGRADAWARGDA